MKRRETKWLLSVIVNETRSYDFEPVYKSFLRRQSIMSTVMESRS